MPSIILGAMIVTLLMFNSYTYHTSIAVVVKLPSRVHLFVTPWIIAHQASLSLTNSQSVPKFTPIASVMPSIHLILWCLLLFQPSIFPGIRGFPCESAVRTRWPKYWSFSFSVSLPNEYSGWFPLRLTGLISSLTQGLSGVVSNTTVWMH